LIERDKKVLGGVDLFHMNESPELYEISRGWEVPSGRGTEYGVCLTSRDISNKRRAKAETEPGLILGEGGREGERDPRSWFLLLSLALPLTP
jgi:hypothetical protein